jgi:hypothetical protein
MPDGPGFLIIGAARSGTSLLSQVLRRHGQGRLLVLGYEDIVADPATKLRESFAFLALGMRSQEPIRKIIRAATPVSARDWLRRSNLRSRK